VESSGKGLALDETRGAKALLVSIRSDPQVGWVDNPSKLERALGGLRLER
jgi:hypothetical protein